MRRAPNTARLIIETLVVVATTEAAVMMLLPLLAPGVAGTARAFLDAVMLCVLAGPVLAWRLRSLLRRSEAIESPPEPGTERRSLVVAGAVFVVGLVTTGVVFVQVRKAEEREARARFEGLASVVASEFERRLSEVWNSLEGARGLYRASKSVERKEFGAYAASLLVQARVPGVNGLGVVERVMKQDLEAFIAKERADDAPDFDVRGIPEAIGKPVRADDMFIVKHCFPAEVNRRDWGTDFGTDVRRREGAERAAYTGLGSATRTTRLSEDVPSGVLLFLPVYKNGTTPATPEERRACLVALVYAPVDLDAFVAAAAGSSRELLGVRLAEAASDGKTGVMKGGAGAASPRFSGVSPVSMHGHEWRLTFASTPAFEAGVSGTEQATVAVVGMSLSAMAAMLVAVTLAGRSRALALAKDMTRDLKSAKEAAEKALTEFDALRRTVDEQSIVSVANARGRIIDVNDLFCRISGYSREELVGQDHRIVNSGTHPKEFWVNVWKSLSAGRVWRGEICNRAKDGSLYWVDTIIAPFIGAGGKVERYVSIRHDITARKLAERRLADSERRLRTIVDAEPECVKLIGADGTLLEMNRAGLEMLGADSVEQVRAMGLRRFVHPEDWEAFAGLHERAKEGEGGTLSFRAVSLRGERRWFETHVVPLRSATGEVEAVLGVTRDTTEQRVAERELSRFKSTLDQTLDCVFMFRDDDLRFVYVNEGAKRQVGYSQAELLSMTPLDIKPAYTREAFDATLEPLRSGAKPLLVFETTHRHRDGHEIPVEVSLQLVRTPGEEARFVAIVRDVSERLAVQRQMVLARDAAEAASRAKSEFLANMSHEIRTPLTSILGYADLLRDSPAGESGEEERRRAVDTIRGAGQHLLTIINDILDLSKIEADRMTVERVDTSLVGVLLEIGSMMLPRAAGKGVALRTSLGSPIPDRILSDPTRLRQILMNLVGNAVKFTEAGSVEVTATVEGTDREERLVVDIADSGPGMTPAQVERLFTPFAQADPSMTRRHGGTGLGLAISRRLAALLGGDVKLLRTAPGQGSCFRVVLPLERAAGAVVVRSLSTVGRNVEPAPAPGTSARLSGRILLAEDGPDNQRLIAFHLRKAGATVDIADNGKIAWDMVLREAAAGTPYDLLLTDMQMPEMDGYTLARSLRATGSTLPIIALTAHAMAEDQARCLAAGCNAYATKPINREALLAACEAWMRARDENDAGSGAAAAA